MAEARPGYRLLYLQAAQRVLIPNHPVVFSGYAAFSACLLTHLRFRPFGTRVPPTRAAAFADAALHSLRVLCRRAPSVLAAVCVQPGCWPVLPPPLLQRVRARRLRLQTLTAATAPTLHATRNTMKTTANNGQDKSCDGGDGGPPDGVQGRGRVRPTPPLARPSASVTASSASALEVAALASPCQRRGRQRLSRAVSRAVSRWS